jgi:hypothetical protein
MPDPRPPVYPSMPPAPQPPAPKPAPAAATPGSLPAADMMTEQEKDQSGTVKGVGPVSPAEVSPGPVETIEEQGIGPRTPYPTGSPPPPSEITIRGQGIKGVTDKPAVKPGEAAKLPEGSKGPVHKAT